MQISWRGTIGGLLLFALGVLWILQGVDALGQDGGMNGEGSWTLIGSISVIAGIGLIVWANRRSRLP